ncbi:hypothetical protein LWI29_007603 [Acer saccharum]|uniref:Uncharacterized protein n=1 Tax=Acer saccharum TaxID=4024 RepID=A0AA39SC12_ACESA|nr:hypothetical protein LWI29_007603 [Acer saccharum]
MRTLSKKDVVRARLARLLMEILSFTDLLGPIMIENDSLLYWKFLAFTIADGRDYRGGDLRVKLERRLSLQRRFSPGRDARGRDRFRGQ